MAKVEPSPSTRLVSDAPEVANTVDKSSHSSIWTAPIRWQKGVVGYFQFVSRRKRDNRFAVFPEFGDMLASLLVAVALVSWISVTFDPLFLQWMKSPGFHSSSFFQIITQFGKVDWILIVTGVALLILSVRTVNKHFGAQYLAWHQMVLYFYFVFTSVAFSGLLATLLKNIFGRARPPVTPDGHFWYAWPFQGNYDYASFPSGHATTGGALGMSLFLLFPKYRWIFLLGGGLIALSRPALGVHYPSDIIAGFCLGSLFVIFYARFFAHHRLLFSFDGPFNVRLRRVKGGMLSHLADLFLGIGTNKTKIHEGRKV